jgi:hypothetical protein
MAAPAVAWFEVTGKDSAALQRCYGELLDWQIRLPPTAAATAWQQPRTGESVAASVGPKMARAA